MSMDFRGDPSSALLEVLDPEQNYNFNDHYLDRGLRPFRDPVHHHGQYAVLGHPAARLQDRMEIIRLPGYTELEKLTISPK